MEKTVWTGNSKNLSGLFAAMGIQDDREFQKNVRRWITQAGRRNAYASPFSLVVTYGPEGVDAANSSIVFLDGPGT